MAVIALFNCVGFKWYIFPPSTSQVSHQAFVGHTNSWDSFPTFRIRQPWPCIRASGSVQITPAGHISCQCPLNVQDHILPRRFSHSFLLKAEWRTRGSFLVDCISSNSTPDWWRKQTNYIGWVFCWYLICLLVSMAFHSWKAFRIINRTLCDPPEAGYVKIH